MVTLRIEHAITDFTTWQAAFARLSRARADAGVLAACVYRPVDDPQFVLIDLDFAGVDDAKAFREFLHDRVWSIPANSPALAGAPLARLVEAEPIQVP